MGAPDTGESVKLKAQSEKREEEEEKKVRKEEQFKTYSSMRSLHAPGDISDLPEVLRRGMCPRNENKV